MFKGITALGAALLSGVVFAGVNQIKECPNMDVLAAAPSGYQEVHTIIPGKLYSSFRTVKFESGEEWAIFIGPIKARNGDSVFDLSDYILDRSAPTGALVYTEEATTCMYDSGMKDVYIAAVNGNDMDDQQNSINTLVKKVQAK